MASADNTEAGSASPHSPGTDISPFNSTALRPRAIGFADESNANRPKAESTSSDEDTLARRESSKARSDDEDPKATFAPHLEIADTINDDSPEAAVNKDTKTDSKKKHFHLTDLVPTGPSKFFNPTNVNFNLRFKSHDDGDTHPTTVKTNNDVSILWRSRDNRKGRNSVVVRPPTTFVERHHPLVQLKHLLLNIGRMFQSFPYWDMAFISGWSYTIGSILFVIDGAWSWGALVTPGTAFAGEAKGVGLLFFFGALFYQVGASVAYLEAVNDGSFQGSAMRRFLEGHQQSEKAMFDEKVHNFIGQFVPHPHRHQHEVEEKEAEEKRQAEIDPEAGWKMKDRTRVRPGSIAPDGKQPSPLRRGGIDLGETEEGEASTYMTWRWWPTWAALRAHHVYEIGYIACAIQLVGATMYGMCGVVALPGVLDSLDQQWKKNLAYWVPQVVASVCFLSAGLLFTLETQVKWWKFEPTVLGWWIGFWATVGSCGFLLCGCFGIASANTGMEFQSDLSSLWGSTAYLFSSLLQWYEAVNKFPVAEFLSEPGEMKSYMIHPI